MAAETNERPAATHDDRRMRGLGTGASAFALGYLLVSLATSGAARSIAASFLGGETEFVPAVRTVVGWIFYNAHAVDLGFGGLAADTSRSPVNYLGTADGVSPLLFILPPVLLVGAGGFVVSRRPNSDWRAVVAAGASIVPAYLALAVVGVFLTTVEFRAAFGGADGVAVLGPDLLATVLVAGVLYPLVFGSLGAGLVSSWDRQPESE